ncbi:MAG TPA: outer membrane lipoprotein-sorting protein [Bryobacteraceae bacterium]|nr:outer membrane lipoprotein-sorting protein [Bryobacteraceae bacterium]
MNRLLGCFLAVVAMAAAQDARQIVAESQNRSRSKSLQYEGTLEVIGPSNKSSVKRWLFERIGAFGTSRAILRFTAPPEVNGVTLLIVNHPDRASEQWMWTPSIQRDRPIALQDRATRFFGTGYSFEDIEERDLNQFDYKLAGADTVDGALCWKIESRPKESKSSQYTLSVLSIRKDNYAVAQIDNYTQDKLIRRIHNSEIQKVDGIWTPRMLEIEDPGRQIRTVLKLENIRYNLPLNEQDFTLEALRSASPPK